MKRRPKMIGVSLVLLLILILIPSGFQIFDYNLECTRCLREYHVVEKSFLGITYSKTQALKFAGYDHEYEEVMGKPCEHIYRTSGFGRQTYALWGSSMGDGQTAEGSLFLWRWMDLKNAYDLYQRLPNKDLMRQTLTIIDECLPADADAKTVDDPNHPNAVKRGCLLSLVNTLADAKTETYWKTALEQAKADMTKEVSAK